MLISFDFPAGEAGSIPVIRVADVAQWKSSSFQLAWS